jgi:hypothetical protein
MSSENKGSQKEPIAQAITGQFGHRIEPGDRVITFTQARRATKVDTGIYLGTMTVKGTWSTSEYYVIERDGGKRTKMYYDGIVPFNTALQELIGSTI